jgi:hypothetical protein
MSSILPLLRLKYTRPPFSSALSFSLLLLMAAIDDPRKKFPFNPFFFHEKNPILTSAIWGPRKMVG